MNGADLLELTTLLLDGEAPDETLFYKLLNMARLKREGKRDWMVLIKKDTAKSLTSSTTPSTGIVVPVDFIRPIKATKKSTPVILLDPATGLKVGSATEIAQQNQYDYSSSGYFWVDYITREMYFTGNPPVSEARTIALFYIYSPGDITDATTWTPFVNVAGQDFSPLLAYDVSIMIKGDIDFDDINARMVSASKLSIEDLEYAMLAWDDRIKLSALGV